MRWINVKIAPTGDVTEARLVAGKIHLATVKRGLRRWFWRTEDDCIRFKTTAVGQQHARTFDDTKAECEAYVREQLGLVDP